MIHLWEYLVTGHTNKSNKLIEPDYKKLIYDFSDIFKFSSTYMELVTWNNVPIRNEWGTVMPWFKIWAFFYENPDTEYYKCLKILNIVNNDLKYSLKTLKQLNILSYDENEKDPMAIKITGIPPTEWKA